MIQEVAFLIAVREFVVEQPVVQVNVAIYAVGLRYPVNNTVRLITFRVNTQSSWIVFTAELNNFATGVPNNFFAGHHIAAAKANRLLRRQALPLARRLFHKVFPIDKQGLTPGHFTLPHTRILMMYRQG